MATKRKPDDGRALIKKMVKAVVIKNPILPILEHVYLTGDQLQVTDLETSVIMPFNSGIEACMPAEKFLDVLDMMAEPVFKAELIEFTEIKKANGCIVEVSEGKRKVKVCGEHPNNFPKVFADEDYFELGELTEEHMKMITIALDYTSTDDLRPAMTGIFFNDHIVATDAHRLYWHPIEAMMQEFILPRKAATTLLRVGASHWRVFGTGKGRLIFLSDEGIIVDCRAIDARFPDYKVVIPHDKCRAVLTINPTVLRKEVKNALRFGNVSTKQVMFCLNGKVEIVSCDVDFEHEYKNELTDNEATVKFHQVKNIPTGTRVQVGERPGHIVSPKGAEDYMVQFDDDDTKFGTGTQTPRASIEILPELCVAFNGDFLDDVAMRLKDEPIEMQLWSPTKCSIVNDHFLIMPLMLNQ